MKRFEFPQFYQSYYAKLRLNQRLGLEGNKDSH